MDSNPPRTNRHDLQKEQKKNLNFHGPNPPREKIEKYILPSSKCVRIILVLSKTVGLVY